MTTMEKRLLNCRNTSDELLAQIAERAKQEKDEETLRKLVAHPSTGPQTLKELASS